MKKLLALFLGALLVTVIAAPAAPRPPDKPNIVIIFIDDMGYGDIGPFGATGQKTPRLDRMAAEGRKFTSFYAAPVCSVSRAQLLSGCYGARISVPGVYGPGSANGLNPAEFTIAERLKALGYATQCIGKWHVGDQPEFLPTRQGFDHYFGIPYSNDMQRKSTDTGTPVVPLLRDEQVIELMTDEAQNNIVERYTDEAIRFIRASKDKPFLLYLPHTAVHVPIHPGDAFRGKSSNGRFGDWVEELDWSTGRILDTLRELKLAERTLVIFTSDNGPWLVKGKDGGSAGPLRGGKGSTWEGGVREPTLAWWPGTIPAGTTCDAVAGTIDLLPTCVSLAGGEVPAEPVIDGRDISGLLLGTTDVSPREAHYYFASYNLQAVRQGPWKLALTPQPETMGRGVAEDARKGTRLYNLDKDIGERTNVADAHPEVVKHLTELFDRMNAEIGGSHPTARRPAGHVDNAHPLYAVSGGRAGHGRPSRPQKPVAPDTLKNGDAISTWAAPQVEKRPFTISCDVETAQADAILVAHGGSAVGYALHLKGGHPAFVVRNSANAVTELVAPERIADRAHLEASLAADGTMTLRVDQAPAVTAKATGTINNQPQEDFCVGIDNNLPLAAYTATGPFTGRLTNLKVTSP